MSTAELKLEIFRKINTLNTRQLEEALGLIENYINSKSNTEEWEQLSAEQQEGINESIRDLDKDEGIPHSVVMEKNKA
jgi:hypothetical protein